MGIQVKGLKEITKGFQQFEFSGPRIQQRFLRLIGDSTVILLKQTTPIDSGELADSWRVLGQGKDYVEVGTSLIGLVEELESGTKPHIIRPVRGNVLRFEIDGQEIFTTEVRHPGTRANPFLDTVARTIHNQIIKVLEQAMSENHRYFAKLAGGKSRKFQQVGRSSAGFKGGGRSTGKSTLVRAGTGRKRLSRRLTLKRRTGRTSNKPRQEPKINLG